MSWELSVISYQLSVIRGAAAKLFPGDESAVRRAEPFGNAPFPVGNAAFSIEAAFIPVGITVIPVAKAIDQPAFSSPMRMSPIPAKNSAKVGPPDEFNVLRVGRMEGLGFVWVV